MTSADVSCIFRFMNANLLAASIPSRTFSSEVTSFEFANALTSDRTDFWKFDSYFLIDATNNKLYINDGSNKTITLTVGSYTGTTLAAHIQTQLNASSTNWTVSYTSSWAFRIQRTSSATLRLSEDTEAIWETIGFISGADTAGTDLNANEQRNHWPYQWIKCDFGFRANIGFFAIIGALPDQSPISTFGRVTIEASNIDDFDSPDLSIEAETTDEGIFGFIDGIDNKYRFWRIKIFDPYNLEGPSPSIGQIYLGEYETINARDISSGFDKTIVDRTESTEAESGKLYFDVKDKYNEINNVNFNLLLRDGKEQLIKLFSQVGIHEPFYISIDPTGKISDSLKDMTHYVYFESNPTFTHLFHEYFNASMAFREAF